MFGFLAFFAFCVYVAGALYWNQMGWEGATVWPYKLYKRLTAPKLQDGTEPEKEG
jgi:thiamine transporter ThiT